MSYFNSRTHAFFTFTRDDEERMRNKFMPSTSEGTLCTYCEEVECSGTSEKDCDSDHRHFFEMKKARLKERSLRTPPLFC